MSEVLNATVFAAIITGIFTLIGKWMETQQKNAVTSPTNIPSSYGAMNVPSSASPPSASVNYGTVLIHIGIIQLVANVIGVITGIIILGLLKASVQVYLLTILIAGTFALVVCFFWSGTKVSRAIMWKHLTYVSIGAVIVTLLIDLLLGGTVNAPTVLLALVQAFFAMGIGGSIALTRKAQIVSVPGSALQYPPPYQQQPQYPPYQQQSAPQRSNDGQHRMPPPPPSQ